jgi:hypothetical protein
MNSLTFSSTLAISPTDFWAQQSLATVNYELGPLIHMTAPKAWQAVRLADWPGGQDLFASWVLFLGVLPIDRHAFGSFTFQPETGFVEDSSSWTVRTWQHVRTVRAHGMGCTVQDTIHFQPRLAILSFLLRPIYSRVFRHRHARLALRYGTLPG